MSAQDKVEDWLENLLETTPDVDEPLLEVILCSASLPGYFDPWKPTQRPYVEIWEDRDFLASTEGYSANHYENATEKETSLQPEWNQRFVVRANGTKFYRFSVGLNFDLRARKVVGECGCAASDAWSVAAQAGGPVAISMKLIRSGPQKKKKPARRLEHKTELFIADNSLLGAESEGIGLRTEPRLDALTDDKDCVYWSRSVSAMRTDDPMWVKTKAGLFLPVELNGVPVLRAESEHTGQDQDVLRLVLKFHPKANYRRFKEYLKHNPEEHNWYYWHKSDHIALSYRSAVFHANQINPQDADAQPFGSTGGFVPRAGGYQLQQAVQLQQAPQMNYHEPEPAPPQNPFATVAPELPPAQMPVHMLPPPTGMPCATMSAPVGPALAYPSSMERIQPALVPVFARPFEPEPAPGPPPPPPAMAPMATMSAPPAAMYAVRSAVEPMAEPGSSMRMTTPMEFAVPSYPVNNSPSPQSDMRKYSYSQASLPVSRAGSMVLAPPTALDVSRSQSLVSINTGPRQASGPPVPVSQSPVIVSMPSPAQSVHLASRQASFASQPGAFAAEGQELTVQASNDELQATTDGLGYRQSMNIADTPAQRDCVFWGNTVQAVRTSDPNWFRVPANGLYLPMYLHGIRVIKEIGAGK